MELDSQAIQAIIPHRWPLLLVDKIIELEHGVRAVGIKQVSSGDIFFQGHFPGFPIMPAVLVVEALAQVAAIALLSDPALEGQIALLSEPARQGKVALFAGIDGFRFRRPVVPGDTLRLDVTMTRVRGHFGKVHARAEVDGQVAAEGELSFALADSAAIKR